MFHINNPQGEPLIPRIPDKQNELQASAATLHANFGGRRPEWHIPDLSQEADGSSSYGFRASLGVEGSGV